MLFGVLFLDLLALKTILDHFEVYVHRPLHRRLRLRHRLRRGIQFNEAILQEFRQLRLFFLFTDFRWQYYAVLDLLGVEIFLEGPLEEDHQEEPHIFPRDADDLLGVPELERVPAFHAVPWSDYLPSQGYYCADGITRFADLIWYQQPVYISHLPVYILQPRPRHLRFVRRW